MSPEQTWNRIRPLLDAHGITRVAEVTGLDRIGIPVFQAVRPASRTVSVSQGKGLDPISARVSAVMEAIELWHAERFVPGSAVIAKPREAAPPYPMQALDLAAGSLLHPDLPLPWCSGTGLLTGAPIPVPVELVRLDHTFHPTWYPPVFRATSNGLASGNTLVEATVHALAEICERDSLARCRAQPPETWTWLDTGSIAEPDVRYLLELFDRDGTGVTVLVAQREPCCVEVRIRSPLHPITYTGAGCHLDPVVALLRALTEAAQSRLTGITGARDDLPELLYRPAAAQGARLPALSGHQLSWAELASGAPSGDLDHHLTTLATALAARTGFEPIRVVLPSPHAVPVVKVIGPGLRFDNRTDVRPAGEGQAGR